MAYEHWDFRLEENWTNFIWGDNLQTLGTVHRTAWSTAIDDWESAADVSILYSSRSANRLESSWVDDEAWYGLTTIEEYDYDANLGWYITEQFLCELNSAASMSATVARSVANHEFGHVFGLDHTTGNSIMNSGRNRNQIYIPQADDIAGVEAIYQ